MYLEQKLKVKKNTFFFTIWQRKSINSAIPKVGLKNKAIKIYKQKQKSWVKMPPPHGQPRVKLKILTSGACTQVSMPCLPRNTRHMYWLNCLVQMMINEYKLQLYKRISYNYIQNKLNNMSSHLAGTRPTRHPTSLLHAEL